MAARASNSRRRWPGGSSQGLLAAEAVDLVKAASFAKFDETVDVAVRLGVDPRHADQVVRGTVVLPHGTGKTVRVLVIAQGDKAKDAEAAGADFVGVEYVQKIKDGWLECDVIVATPDVMGQVGQLGRILGPRGLMPNPKAGTVTMDVARRSARSRPARSSSGWTRPATCTRRSARCRLGRPVGGEPVAVHGHDRPGEAGGGQGHLRPVGHGLEHDGARRATGYGGVPMSKTERQAMVETLAERVGAVAQPLFDGLHRADGAADDGLPPAAPGGRRRYAVVKNTLAQRALADARYPGSRALGRADGLVLAGDDPVTAAKVLADFIKEHERPALKSGLVDGKTMTPADIKRLASLPSRDELLGQFAGALQAPLANSPAS